MRGAAASLIARCARRAPGAVESPGIGALAARRSHGTASHGSGGVRPDHLTRTAGEPREDIVSDAKLIAVHEETPTVRELVLEVSDQAFTFRAGNWVDFFIDGCPKIGGYSMCSTPSELPKLRLAVKRSLHPPAAWCHSEACAIGAHVQMKAGGKFCWDPAGYAERSAEHLLLVAGGIGINPLYSMAQAALLAPRSSFPQLRRISLLYSASRPSELAYRLHLEELARGDERLRLSLRVTRNDGAEQEPWEGLTGRVGVAELRAALSEESAGSKVVSYVCGPPAMTDALVDVLRSELGLPKEMVRSEKWW
mmetsp:Transcript_91206/g.292859  ORF Transcript_91206/g.292859 Transcript_91206/m.292859 type:complete len:309 (-) Transcript_91206:75-1001(-)